MNGLKQNPKQCRGHLGSLARAEFATFDGPHAWKKIPFSSKTLNFPFHCSTLQLFLFIKSLTFSSVNKILNHLWNHMCHKTTNSPSLLSCSFLLFNPFSSFISHSALSPIQLSLLLWAFLAKSKHQLQANHKLFFAYFFSFLFGCWPPTHSTRFFTY